MHVKWHVHLCLTSLLWCPIRTLRNKRFQRDGNDLKYNLTISLVDALTGFTTEVTFCL